MQKLDERPIEELRRDIAKAQEFIRKRFNAYVDEKTTPSHLLAPMTCAVHFPDVDRVSVCKVAYEQLMHAAIAEYRLTWKNGKMFWKGGFLLRPDIVTMIEVR